MLKSLQCVSSIIFLSTVAYLDEVQGIVGGDLAEHGKYPFIASLQWDNRHKCGGALIDADTVLTVAHCIPLLFVNRSQMHRATVLLGTVNQAEPGPGSRRVAISSVKFLDVRPFNFSTISTEALEKIHFLNFPNDYAQLKLAERVRETPLIRIGRLAPLGMPKINSVCTILGWGRYLFPDTFPQRANNFSTLLRKGQMLVSNRNAIGRIPRTMTTIDPIPDGDTGWHGSPCFGDSGSPMICKDGANKSYIAGLLEAAKIPCDDMRAFAVAMRVDVLRNWIKNNSKTYLFKSQSPSFKKVGFFAFFLCVLGAISAVLVFAL